jgi:hypothetical protein
MSKFDENCPRMKRLEFFGTAVIFWISVFCVFGIRVAIGLARLKIEFTNKRIYKH